MSRWREYLVMALIIVVASAGYGAFKEWVRIHDSRELREVVACVREGGTPIVTQHPFTFDFVACVTREITP